MEEQVLYELKRLYFIYSGSFVVPKASLRLYLLTGDHFSTINAEGASVGALLPLFEQHKPLVHPLNSTQHFSEHHVAAARRSVGPPSHQPLRNKTFTWCFLSGMMK